MLKIVIYETVLWRDLSNDVADATKEELDAVKGELRSNQTKRWEAIYMLKHIFASAKLPWVLKRHAINFLFCIMEGVEFLEHNDEPLDYSVYMPRLYTALQVLSTGFMVQLNCFECLRNLGSNHV